MSHLSTPAHCSWILLRSAAWRPDSPYRYPYLDLRVKELAARHVSPVSEFLSRDCRDKTRALTITRVSCFSSVPDIDVPDATRLGSTFPAHKKNQRRYRHRICTIRHRSMSVFPLLGRRRASLSVMSVYPDPLYPRYAGTVMSVHPDPVCNESTLVTASCPYSGVAPRHSVNGTIDVLRGSGNPMPLDCVA